MDLKLCIPSIRTLSSVRSLNILMVLSLLLTGQYVLARSLPNDGEIVLLSIFKDTLTAELDTLPPAQQPQKLLRKFQIALGKAEGDKEKEGDNKTPEGIYFTKNHINGKSLPPKYGPYAIPINFPNPIDQRFGKTGYGIWLHGVEDNKRIEAAKVTEGCIAFFNQDIFALANWLKPYQGIVMISAHQEQVNRKEDVAEVIKLTQSWAEAWMQRRHRDYISFYHPDFTDNTKDLNAYSAYKKRVFASYKKMDLNIYDIRVISHPKYAVAIMNQDFDGDKRFVSRGRKILYWLKNSQGQYRIYSEGFEQRRFEKMNSNTLQAVVPDVPNPTQVRGG